MADFDFESRNIVAFEGSCFNNVRLLGDSTWILIKTETVFLDREIANTNYIVADFGFGKDNFLDFNLITKRFSSFIYAETELL